MIRGHSKDFARGFWSSVFLAAFCFLPPAPPATLPAALSHRPASLIFRTNLS